MGNSLPRSVGHTEAVSAKLLLTPVRHDFSIRRIERPAPLPRIVSGAGTLQAPIRFLSLD